MPTVFSIHKQGEDSRDLEAACVVESRKPAKGDPQGKLRTPVKVPSAHPRSGMSTCCLSWFVPLCVC